jgi:membrane dipeptidase
MMVHNWTHRRSKPEDFNLKMVKICEHIDHICQIAGNAKHVGIGTDLDGGYGTEQTPMDLNSIADLVTLAKPLADRGYSAEDIEGIYSGNFLRFLREHLK